MKNIPGPQTEKPRQGRGFSTKSSSAAYLKFLRYQRRIRFGKLK
jgi:hypothetical protein